MLMVRYRDRVDAGLGERTGRVGPPQAADHDGLPLAGHRGGLLIHAGDQRTLVHVAFSGPDHRCALIAR